MTELRAASKYDEWALNALVLLPLVGALLIMLLPARLARGAALALSLAEALVGLGLWWAYDAAGGMQLRYGVAWIREYGIYYHVAVDGLSVFLVTLSALLMPLCIWSSW